jgi:hypothetical protein
LSVNHDSKCEKQEKQLRDSREKKLGKDEKEWIKVVPEIGDPEDPRKRRITFRLPRRYRLEWNLSEWAIDINVPFSSAGVKPEFALLTSRVHMETCRHVTIMMNQIQLLKMIEFVWGLDSIPSFNEDSGW